MYGLRRASSISSSRVTCGAPSGSCLIAQRCALYSPSTTTPNAPRPMTADESSPATCSGLIHGDGRARHDSGRATAVPLSETATAMLPGTLQ